MSNTARGDGSHRPTKAERKEAARIEREQIQRSMAARKRNRRIGIAVVALAAVVAGAAAFVLRPGDAGTAATGTSPQQLLDQADAARTSAGCDQVQTIAPYDGVEDPEDPNYTDQAHLGSDQQFTQLPPLDSYPSIPPTSGPHADIPPGPLPAGVYDSAPDLARVLHSLEHGASVVWYDPTISTPDLSILKEFYDRRVSDAKVGQDRVIVAPYDYPGPGGQLPEGVTMSLVAWHRLQACSQVSLPVAFDFTSQYSFPAVLDAGDVSGTDCTAVPDKPELCTREYLGEAPEAGGAL